mgnify:FL=1
MDRVEEAARRIRNSLKSGGKLILFGNGGSAAESQHIAAEFVGHDPPLAALSLTTDTSALTAIANDYGFEYIFERQVRALCKKKDAVMGISTSWKSRDVFRGILAAKEIGAFTIALTGRRPAMADLTINVDSDNTQEIQEAHVRIGHRLAELVSKG